jgi:hypothetical protein
MILGLFAIVPVRGDVSGLSVGVGDHWTYNFSTLSSPLNLTGTLKLTVVGAATINWHGASVDAYKVSSEGSGYATGGIITGSWTISGTQYQRRSDFANLNGTVSITIQANSITANVVVRSDASPAQEQVTFPLYMGKTWTQTVTTNTDLTTTLTIPPNPPTVTTKSTSNTTTTTYAVIDNPVVKVDAGSFDSYEIRSSDKGSVSLQYYSPQVSAPVKSVSSNSTTGQVTSSMTLKEYGTFPYGTSYNLSGTSGVVYVQSDVSPSNFQQTATALSFTLTGRDGTSGHVAVTLPLQFNTTDLTVYVDNQVVAPTISRTSSNYTISFNLAHYSSHVVKVSYASSVVQTPSQPQSSLTLYLILGGAAIAIIVIVAVALVVRRRGRTAPSSGPSQQPPPSSAPQVEPQPAMSPAKP